MGPIQCLIEISKHIKQGKWRKEPKRWVGVSGWGVTVLACWLPTGHQWPTILAAHCYLLPPLNPGSDSETTQNFDLVWGAVEIEFFSFAHIDNFSVQCSICVSEPIPHSSVFEFQNFQPHLFIFKLSVVSWQRWPLTWPLLQLPLVLVLRKNEWF